MRPLPISREEFARFLQRARPPNGWSEHIGVANSGGPDSTCLLFLIQRYIEDSRPSPATSPSRVFSLTIDHGLQPSSASMAAHCANTAASLHIPHMTTKVPWGTPPYPPLPKPDQPFESTARAVRYNLLWKNAQKENIGVLALGHHADDQVETALMRLGKHSSDLGGRGMHWCRRWGMGTRDELEWIGHEGMNKWIIRPMLELSKDRILATCEENELTYVTDPTNFQPDITLRNALRAIISARDKGVNPPDSSTLPPQIQEQLTSINKTITSFTSLSVDLTSSSERLRAAVKAIDVLAADVESQATSQLEKIRLSSPPGTFILSTRTLQDITNPLLRRAIILRILRYISFHPWGSLRSQARRSRHSLDQIINKVWNPDPFASGIRGFVAGGGVLWVPVSVDPTEATPSCLDVGGRIKRPNPDDIASGKVQLGRGIVGWMATRQPPHRPEKMREYGLEDTLNVDLTGTLKQGLVDWDEGKGSGPQVVEVLWDCRFLVRFDLAEMPKRIVNVILARGQSGDPKLVIRWWTKYYFPKVVLIPSDGQVAWSETEGKEVVLHSNIDLHTPSLLSLLKSDIKGKSVSVTTMNRYKEGGSTTGNTPLITSNWISTSWIRILDAT